MAMSFKKLVFRNEPVLDDLDNFLRHADATLATGFAQIDEAQPGKGTTLDPRDEGAYFDFVSETQSSLFSSLVGATLVVAQSTIGIMFQQMLKHEAKLPWLTGVTGMKAKRDAVMRRHGDDRIFEINALANYFKHHEEWDPAWYADQSKVKSNATDAFAVALKYGMNKDLDLDFLEAMKKFCPYTKCAAGFRLAVLHKTFTTWRDKLVDDAERAGCL